MTMLWISLIYLISATETHSFRILGGRRSDVSFQIHAILVCSWSPGMDEVSVWQEVRVLLWLETSRQARVGLDGVTMCL